MNDREEFYCQVVPAGRAVAPTAAATAAAASPPPSPIPVDWVVGRWPDQLERATGATRARWTGRSVTTSSSARLHMSAETTPTAKQAFSFRPDIQGIRALAVLLVIVNHLAPGLLPGGYVGVDVFFVVSGYLITVAAPAARPTRAVEISLGGLLRSAGPADPPRRDGRHDRDRRRLAAHAAAAAGRRRSSPTRSGRRFFAANIADGAGRHRLLRPGPAALARCGTTGRSRSRSSSTWCGRPAR